MATESDLLKAIDEASALAIAPISEFAVGSALEGLSGQVYLGYNIELPFLGLAGTLHAEQVAMVSAVLAGEQGVKELAVTAVPCGHCRQFLYEFCAPELPIIIKGQDRKSLLELFPYPFGPEDLGVSSFWDREPIEIEPPKVIKPGLADALDRLQQSYCPYSGVPVGVAVKTKEGSWVSGFGLESAAFNPSVTPFHSVLIQLFEQGIGIQNVTEVVIAAGYFEEEDDVISLYQGNWEFLASRCFPKASMTLVPVLCHE